MPQIKLENIISCSSEDSTHVASNLLNSDTTKKWKSKSTGELSVSVIIQLEKSCKISGVDIGNEWSGFVEVFVGRSTTQNEYELLLSMSSFMTPMECRNNTNGNRVRMFSYNDLSAATRDQQWDRMKIVCTQPFNKHIQYGLSFITLHTPTSTLTSAPVSTTRLGKFTLRPESPETLPTGSLFAKRKEIETETDTVAAIKKNLGNPIKIQTPSSSSNSSSTKNNTEIKNRNRKNLFYDSDDCEDQPKQDEAEEKETKTRTRKQALKKTATTKKKESDETKTKNETKRKTTTAETVKIPVKKLKMVTKPFHELLNGVVFTISGIMNPERADLRQSALEMGAKYKGDWDQTCTHLICAFANTPKFQQVRGKGKIVTKSWLEDCHQERKRLPWRRYALDQNDQNKPESEDEINETTNEPEQEEENEIELPTTTATSNNERNNSGNENEAMSGSDTDDEIEKIIAKQNQTNTGINTLNDPYEMETDEEVLTKNPKEIKESVPNLFRTEMFYIDNNGFGDEEINKLERLIKAHNGAVLSRVSDLLDYIITNEDSVDVFKRDHSDCSATFVKSSWIYECSQNKTILPIDKYKII